MFAVCEFYVCNSWAGWWSESGFLLRLRRLSDFLRGRDDNIHTQEKTRLRRLVSSMVGTEGRLPKQNDTEIY